MSRVPLIFRTPPWLMSLAAARGVSRAGAPLPILFWGVHLIEVMEFDPLEEFAPERHAGVAAGTQSQRRDGLVLAGSPLGDENPVAAPRLRRSSSGPRERLASIRSLGFAVLFVAAAVPWFLLTRDLINAGGGLSELKTAVETSTDHAAPSPAPALLQTATSPQVSVAAIAAMPRIGSESSEVSRDVVAHAAPGAAASEIARRRAPVRARPGNARGDPASVDGKGDTTLVAHGSLPGTNVGSSPPSASGAPMVSDVVRVSELEILESIILDGSGQSGSESQPRFTPAVGATRVEVTAEASDPDGDPVSFKWTAPAGSFANPMAKQTEFTCPSAPAAVPVTISVTDANGAVAHDTITIQCVYTTR